MRPVRAVLFDLDHTLFDTAKTERVALGILARAKGFPLGPKALDAYRVVNTHVWAEYRSGRITSKELRILRFHLWLERLGQDTAHAKTMAPMYLREFSSRSDLIPGARSAVSQMNRAGLRLGIVTNGIDRVQRKRLRASGLDGHFPIVITSERSGFTKPDPRIFEAALRRSRVSPDEAVYVGDDPEVDGGAANGAGIAFVWFNPGKVRLRPKSRVEVHGEIERLSDLAPLVDRRGR